MKQRALVISSIVVFSVILSAVFIFKKHIQKKTKEYVVGAVMDGFSNETAQTRFLSYATAVVPLKRLELAKINQLEIFERTSQVKLFWDRFNLPDVVVRATVPVEYRYYIELDGQWEIVMKDNIVNVLAPTILAGTPAPDISKLKFEVQKGSLFRNEVKVAESLQKDLSAMLQTRAQESSHLVREAARGQVESFVKQWLTSESSGASINVRFVDEEKVSY